MNALRAALAITAHDVRLEFRRPVVLSGMALLSVGSLVIVHLAIAGSGRVSHGVAAGALWIVLLFGALLGIGRTLAAEREDDTWDALLLAPVDRTALFFGKAGTAFVLMASLHAFVVPVFIALFPTPGNHDWTAFLAALAMADLGFALVGVLVGAIGLRVRTREVLVAAMMLPLTMPLVIVAVAATVTAIDPGDTASMARYLGFLALYDAVFLALGFGVFPEVAVD